MRDLELANRLRARGLRVIEVEGWRERGSDSFNPRGSVNHHTAGSSRGNAPSLGGVINGTKRPDGSFLPGPHANVYTARDNTVYVIASGRAIHAGLGGWKGLEGNSSVYGVENENVGTSAEPWRPDQVELQVQIHAAFLEGIKNASSDLVCQHFEWAPTRKIDAHDIDGNDFRRRVAEALKPVPVPPVLEESEMPKICKSKETNTLWAVNAVGRRALEGTPGGATAMEVAKFYVDLDWAEWGDAAKKDALVVPKAWLDTVPRTDV